MQQEVGPAERRGRGVVPRRPLVAVALSLCPGLGQQYAGHLLRGIALYTTLIITSWLAAIAFMYVESRIGVVLLALPFVGFAAIALDAWRCAARQPREYRLRWYNRGWIYAGVAVTLMLTVNPLMDRLVGSNIVRAYFVTSASMAPTVLHHDLLLINKLARPTRGDLVLLEFSEEAERQGRLSSVIGQQLLRRVIALPGDTVAVRDHAVLLNGEPVEEPYVQETSAEGFTLVGEAEGAFGPVEVPPGHLFVLADNRRFGMDSRLLGFIPQAQVAGVATKIFWSWNFADGGIKWSRTARSL